jgi:hypothetical protein
VNTDGTVYKIAEEDQREDHDVVHVRSTVAVGWPRNAGRHRGESAMSAGARRKFVARALLTISFSGVWTTKANDQCGLQLAIGRRRFRVSERRRAHAKWMHIKDAGSDYVLAQYVPVPLGKR